MTSDPCPLPPSLSGALRLGSYLAHGCVQLHVCSRSARLGSALPSRHSDFKLLGRPPRSPSTPLPSNQTPRAELTPAAGLFLLLVLLQGKQTVGFLSSSPHFHNQSQLYATVRSCKRGKKNYKKEKKNSRKRSANCFFPPEPRHTLTFCPAALVFPCRPEASGSSRRCLHCRSVCTRSPPDPVILPVEQLRLNAPIHRRARWDFPALPPPANQSRQESSPRPIRGQAEFPPPPLILPLLSCGSEE